jgi:hypothetical protein
VDLASFIVFNTPSHVMHAHWGMEKPEMTRRHILFQEEDRDTYIGAMLLLSKDFPSPAVLFFVDLEPEANWAHSCAYVLVAETGETAWCDARWPPYASIPPIVCKRNRNSGGMPHRP